MLIFFKINSLGEGLGPTFILTDDFGLTDPFEFTKQELLDGVYINITPGSKSIYVKSTGIFCKDCCDPNAKHKYLLPTTTTTSTSTTTTTTIPPTTTTTTTITPTTTTTTTLAPAELCFLYSNEGYGTYSCSPIQQPVLFNSKPYFILSALACGGFAPTFTTYIYWNIVNNRWECGTNLGNSGVAPGSLLYGHLNVTTYLPISTITDPWITDTVNSTSIVIESSSPGVCCICTKIQYESVGSYSGTYIDCNGDQQNWVISNTGLPSVQICTSHLQLITYNTSGATTIVLGDCQEVPANPGTYECYTWFET